MIPKIIHYCWFGGGKLPKLYRKCIESWSIYAPEFKIILWDESNFDINSIVFARDAYSSKKYAFVSDYVRLHALTTMGGIYLDTDIELLKPLETLLHHNGFAGFETPTVIQTGILGCEPGNEVFVRFFETYKDMKFDSNSPMIPNSAIFTSILKYKGLQLNDTYQIIDDIHIFPQEFFCPINQATREIAPTPNSFCIHYLSGSWFPRRHKIINMMKRCVGEVLGYHFVFKLRNFFK